MEDIGTLGTSGFNFVLMKEYLDTASYVRLTQLQKRVLDCLRLSTGKSFDWKGLNVTEENSYLSLSTSNVVSTCPFSIFFYLDDDQMVQFYLNYGAAVMEQELRTESDVQMAVQCILDILKSEIKEIATYYGSKLTSVRYEFTLVVDGKEEPAAHSTHKGIPLLWRKKEVSVKTYKPWI